VLVWVTPTGDGARARRSSPAGSGDAGPPTDRAAGVTGQGTQAL
jgi:hypothetical protein